MRKHIVQGTHKAQMLLAKSVAQIAILHIGGNKQIVLIGIQWYNPSQGYPKRAMPCEKNTSYIICVKHSRLTSYRSLDSLYALNHSADFRSPSRNGVEGLKPKSCSKGVVSVYFIILLFRVTYLFAIPLVNDISILYVFQPCFLLRKVMAEIEAFCGIEGMKDV